MYKTIPIDRSSGRRGDLPDHVLGGAILAELKSAAIAYTEAALDAASPEARRAFERLAGDSARRYGQLLAILQQNRLAAAEDAALPQEMQREARRAADVARAASAYARRDKRAGAASAGHAGAASSQQLGYAVAQPLGQAGRPMGSAYGNGTGVQERQAYGERDSSAGSGEAARVRAVHASTTPVGLTSPDAHPLHGYGSFAAAPTPWMQGFSPYLNGWPQPQQQASYGGVPSDAAQRPGGAHGSSARVGGVYSSPPPQHQAGEAPPEFALPHALPFGAVPTAAYAAPPPMARPKSALAPSAPASAPASAQAPVGSADAALLAQASAEPAPPDASGATLGATDAGARGAETPTGRASVAAGAAEEPASESGPEAGGASAGSAAGEAGASRADARAGKAAESPPKSAQKRGGRRGKATAAAVSATNAETAGEQPTL